MRRFRVGFPGKRLLRCFVHFWAEKLKGVFYLAEKLKIIPLGGLDEIGKNITVLEDGKDMIVVVCGIGFPDVVM